jgi:hypothetical protein
MATRPSRARRQVERFGKQVSLDPSTDDREDEEGQAAVPG